VKILKAKVNWKDGWANSPMLQVLVDKIPARNELRYEQRGSIYYAEYQGYVEFFSWSGKQEDGYGGRHFRILMKDETEIILKGPWSSRAGVINKIGFGPCLDVSITDDGEVWNKGYTYYAGSITVESLKSIFPLVDIGDKRLSEKDEFALAIVVDNTDIRFDPCIRSKGGAYWHKSCANVHSIVHYLNQWNFAHNKNYSLPKLLKPYLNINTYNIKNLESDASQRIVVG